MKQKISMIQEIRNYVKKHNNTVTSREVIKYILEERRMETTENTIRGALRIVLKETGGTLKKHGLKHEIRNYVKAHNNTVTSKEVITYIFEEKKMEVNKKAIHNALRIVLKEEEGILKDSGLTHEIRNYVKKHNNTVTSKEVITYILEEKKIKTSKNSIYKILNRVLKKEGGKIIHTSSK